MCGRYVILTEEENIEIREILNEINDRFKDQAANIKTGEIFPTNTVPVITRGDISKELNLYKWGFSNFKQKSSVIINARCETLEEKPTFRKIFHTQRCLIPASGFYEWKSEEGKKVKYLIRASNQKLFYMAGLYNNFVDKSGNPYKSFVIITTNANSQMSEIHNRMPVILNSDQRELWLHANNTDEVKQLLKPYDEQFTDISVA